MGGWDSDKSGDYVPSPPPIWLWVIICLGLCGAVCARDHRLRLVGKGVQKGSQIENDVSRKAFYSLA